MQVLWSHILNVDHYLIKKLEKSLVRRFWFLSKFKVGLGYIYIGRDERKKRLSTEGFIPFQELRQNTNITSQAIFLLKTDLNTVFYMI